MPRSPSKAPHTAATKTPATGSLFWVRNSAGYRVASCPALDAAIHLIAQYPGGTIRWNSGRKQFIVWREGSEHISAKVDPAGVGAVILARIRARQAGKTPSATWGD